MAMERWAGQQAQSNTNGQQKGDDLQPRPARQVGSMSQNSECTLSKVQLAIAGAEILCQRHHPI